MQQAAVLGVQKVEEGQKAAHHLADARGPGSTGQPEPEHAHQQKVQHHVGHTGEKGEHQPQPGLFGGDKEALEADLQHEGGQGQQVDAAVQHAVGDHGLALGTQQNGQGPHEHEGQKGQYNAGDQGGVHDHGEIAVGLGLIALAQRFGNQRAAAGAHHEAQGRKTHQHGVHQIQGGEGHGAHVVGDEQAVHNAVNGSNDHHHDGGQHKAQKPPVRKMVGKLDLHGDNSL